MIRLTPFLDFAALLLAIYVGAWAWGQYHQPPIVVRFAQPVLVMNASGGLADEADRIILGDLCQVK